MTQADLGTAVGRRAQSISGYESGENVPSPIIIRALDRILDADGEIVKLYGLSPLPAADEIRAALAELVNRLEGLERQDGDRAAVIGDLVRRLEQLERSRASGRRSRRG